jgi:tRNA dimethylallyltransferase
MSGVQLKENKQIKDSPGPAGVRRLKEDLAERKKVIVICGPTGIGKTGLGIEIARLFDTGIISADSMQVYRGMDIGTGKADSGKYGVRQFMIDLFEPDHEFTVREFRDRAEKILKEDFLDAGKVPLLVGGSGMYIKAVLDGIDESPGKNSGFRAKIEEDMEKEGTKKYYEKLKEIDGAYAAKISKNDKRRILRALEVYEAAGSPYSDFQRSWKRQARYNAVMIGLKRERSSLYRIIEERVDNMFEKGLVDEVKSLVGRGYGKCQSLVQAVGYKEVLGFLEHRISLEECKRQVKTNSRRLAKKQMTWFRHDDRINWLSVDNYDNISDLIKESLMIIGQDQEYGKDRVLKISRPGK